MTNRLLTAQTSGDYLSLQLAERIARNPRYSLRAFAKSIDISPAHLSCLLKGKRRLSVEKGCDIALKLRLPKEEADHFLDLVQFESSRTEAAKNYLRSRRGKSPAAASVAYREVTAEEFDLLSAWYYIPILALIDVTDGTFSPQLVSERLGLSPAEATLAVHALEKKGLLKQTDDGLWVRSESHFIFKSASPNKRLRHFHRMMLNRAIHSLYVQNPQERITRTETLALGPDQLEAARVLTREYAEKLAQLSKASKQRTEVYHFSLHGFRVTQGRQACGE